jgi:hypothetical protein
MLTAVQQIMPNHQEALTTANIDRSAPLVRVPHRPREAVLEQRMASVCFVASSVICNYV